MRGHSRTPGFDKRKYPLRMVIERGIRVEEYNGVKAVVYLNKLECGHLVRPAKDFYGEIFSIKQRCRFCQDELKLKATLSL